MQRRSAAPLRTPFAAVLAIVLMALVPAGCGGDDAVTKPPPGSPSNPLAALPNPTPTRVPSDPEAAPTNRKGFAEERRAATLSQRQHAAQRAAERRRTKTDRNAATAGERPEAPRKQPLATRASARTPCALVTKVQAQALMGVPILEPLQAPQGPTCIYRTRSGKSFVTLSVQALSIKKLRAQMRDARRVDISQRTGYCGMLGRSTLIVALSSSRVLSVTAPCSVASGFAARAVRMLPA